MRDLGNIRSELHHRAPTVSPRFIYMQQYTEPQPTPKHTYTNHSRHVKLNLTQGTSVHDYMCVHEHVCLKEGWRKGKISKNMSSSLSISGAWSEILQWLCCSILNAFFCLRCSCWGRAQGQMGVNLSSLSFLCCLNHNMWLLWEICRIVSSQRSWGKIQPQDICVLCVHMQRS